MNEKTYSFDICSLLNNYKCFSDDDYFNKHIEKYIKNYLESLESFDSIT